MSPTVTPDARAPRGTPTFRAQGASQDRNRNADQDVIEPNGKSREHGPDARAEGQLSAGAGADVRAAAFGDDEAFERIYRAHVSRIYGLACRMAGSERADELTQDVFVRAWEKLGTFRGESAFSSWLYRLAVNLLCSRLRALKLQRERETASEISLATARARHDSIEIRLDFEVALERLPDGAREVFVLHDVEGYKHREIAERMDITAGTSKSQLHRARMILRRHLDR